jgi:predicted Zn-dependent peptidase
MIRLFLTILGLLMLLTSSLLSAEWQITDLDNGLKVMILEAHQVPQVNISTTVKVGAKNETDFYDGATHLLEHLILFRGTEKMTGEKVGEEMRRHGAYFNGSTSQDWTDFEISLPAEYLEFALQIHSDMLFRSNFGPEAMNEERQAVMEEININEDNPGAKVYYSSLKSLYKGHPYEKDVLGTKGNIGNIPRDSVYAYYKRYYAPNNMTLAIVGDINAAAALELVKKYFADIKPGTAPPDQYNPPPKYSQVTKIEIKKDIAQAYLMMGMVGPKADSPDQYALDLLSNIIGGGQSSRLWKRLKDQLGIVNSIYFAFSTSKYEGPIYASAVLEPAKIPEAETAIREILADAKKGDFTENELRKAKNSLLTAFYISHEVGLDIADSYAQYDSFIGYKYLEDYPGKIEKVTLADLTAVAQKYLNTDSYILTTVVPK